MTKFSMKSSAGSLSLEDKVFFGKYLTKDLTFFRPMFTFPPPPPSPLKPPGNLLIFSGLVFPGGVKWKYSPEINYVKMGYVLSTSHKATSATFS